MRLGSSGSQYCLLLLRPILISLSGEKQLPPTPLARRSLERPKSRLTRVIIGENQSGVGDLLGVFKNSFKLQAPSSKGQAAHVFSALRIYSNRVFKDLKDYKTPHSQCWPRPFAVVFHRQPAIGRWQLLLNDDPQFQRSQYIDTRMISLLNQDQSSLRI